MSLSKFRPLILADVLIGLAWFVGPPFRQPWVTVAVPAWIICLLHFTVPRYVKSISEEAGVKLLHVKWLPTMEFLQNDFFASIYWRHFTVRLIQFIYCRTAQNIPHGNGKSASPWTDRMQHLLIFFVHMTLFKTMTCAGQVFTQALFGK